MNDGFTTYSPQEYIPIFKIDNIPIFTQKTFTSISEAKKCSTGRVNLVQSKKSGFVFNADFNPLIMNYDKEYNNEQGFSKVFRNHLSQVAELITKEITPTSKVVEIGCGKGRFFNILKSLGVNITGFDPTYEGGDPGIIKDYFSEKYDTNADFLILRHTLEHIKDPFSFLHEIAKANRYKGKIFIEVPTYEWIVDRGAFWDITYEHCNYFTQETLASLFHSSRTGKFFGDQYIYVVAKLSDLKMEIKKNSTSKQINNIFCQKIQEYQKLLNGMNSVALWGGATKGLLFLNQCDQLKEKVEYVIDLNPAKQNRFMARTGHKIYSPNVLKKNPVKNILVANENYLEEVIKEINNPSINVIPLK